jgi:hypothetical protein
MAKGPEGLGSEKYDAAAVSMVRLLRYGSGVLFHRLEQLDDDLGVPLPASTHWDIVAGVAKKIEPAFEELITQAAQGLLLHNDDTTMQVLALQAELRANAVSDDSSDKRTGTFTTGILAHVEDLRVALVLSGQQHAGENMADVFRPRAANRPPPILLCDGLARDLPPEFEVILSSCLAHGRRQFVDTFDSFLEGRIASYQAFLHKVLLEEVIQLRQKCGRQRKRSSVVKSAGGD